MSITTRPSIAFLPKLRRKQKNSLATRTLGSRIDPDLMAVCAFATIGLLVTGCLALAFPEWRGVFVW
jgi:hypothetical protein